jgi:adenylate kinase
VHGELILMGPPGSGKGTQARLLADTPGWVHVATGDLFREHLRKGTPLGKLAEGYMAKGAYVPDDVTVGMVRERLREIPPRDHIVFDGFPRTVPQAQALDDLLREHGRRVNAAIVFEVPRDMLIERLAHRLTCARCQMAYSADKPPRVGGTCDQCGGDVRATARADDSPEVVRRRLEVYDEETRPVVEHYQRLGLLRKVDGVGDVTEVHGRVRGALSSPREVGRA